MSEKKNESLLSRDFGNIRVQVMCHQADAEQVKQMLAEIPEDTDGYHALASLLTEPVLQASASDLTRTPQSAVQTPWAPQRQMN
ncbi:MAG: hypothetical protein WC043_06465 [Pseudobdellovibrionaceae bacterium]